MKVVLRSDVDKLGSKGDVVEVAPGYARNYLVPRGLALQASPGAIAQAASMRRARDLREARDREGAQALADKLAPLALRIEAKAGAEGRLFGSVTAADVAAVISAESGIEIDRRRVQLVEPIRAVGVHQITFKLHPEVEVSLDVEVVAGAS